MRKGWTVCLPRISMGRFTIPFTESWLPPALKHGSIFCWRILLGRRSTGIFRKCFSEMQEMSAPELYRAAAIELPIWVLMYGRFGFKNSLTLHTENENIEAMARYSWLGEEGCLSSEAPLSSLKTSGWPVRRPLQWQLFVSADLGLIARRPFWSGTG